MRSLGLPLGTSLPLPACNVPATSAAALASFCTAEGANLGL